MSLISMTGYGRGSAVSRGVKAEVEISSVNRKQFDVRLTLPGSLSGHDAQIKKIIHDSIARGSITGIVRIGSVSKGQGSRVSVDVEKAKICLRELRKAGRKLGVEDDVTLSDLMRVPELVKFNDGSKDPNNNWPLVKRAMKEALGNLVAMRETEGAELEKDIERRIAKLKKIRDAVSKRVPAVERRINKRVRAKLKDAGLPYKSSDERLQREILFYIDKADISEELVRLESHFKHSEKLMGQGGPVGRAMDFLCQELFREINTIGSKANDAVIARQVVLFKTELECIREQVQNIE
ncbi:YicC family protein [bacterium E08(2017)]|nr:YicC family protein [bacterium E08(2017)]